MPLASQATCSQLLNNPAKAKGSSTPRRRGTGQLASPEKPRRDPYLPRVSLVTCAHYPLHFSLQFHRKCELSTACDGGELKDHILLPTSICPVTRVSGPAPTGLWLFQGLGSEAGDIHNLHSPECYPTDSQGFCFGERLREVSVVPVRLREKALTQQLPTALPDVQSIPSKHP